MNCNQPHRILKSLRLQSSVPTLILFNPTFPFTPEPLETARATGYSWLSMAIQESRSVPQIPSPASRFDSLFLVLQVITSTGPGRDKIGDTIYPVKTRWWLGGDYRWRVNPKTPQSLSSLIAITDFCLWIRKPEVLKAPWDNACWLTNSKQHWLLQVFAGCFGCSIIILHYCRNLCEVTIYKWKTRVIQTSTKNGNVCHNIIYNIGSELDTENPRNKRPQADSSAWPTRRSDENSKVQNNTIIFETSYSCRAQCLHS